LKNQEKSKIYGYRYSDKNKYMKLFLHYQQLNIQGFRESNFNIAKSKRWHKSL